VSVPTDRHSSFSDFALMRHVTELVFALSETCTERAEVFFGVHLKLFSSEWRTFRSGLASEWRTLRSGLTNHCLKDGLPKSLPTERRRNKQETFSVSPQAEQQSFHGCAAGQKCCEKTGCCCFQLEVISKRSAPSSSVAWGGTVMSGLLVSTKSLK
jgi:hypothetical protein